MLSITQSIIKKYLETEPLDGKHFYTAKAIVLFKPGWQSG